MIARPVRAKILLYESYTVLLIKDTICQGCFSNRKLSSWQFGALPGIVSAGNNYCFEFKKLFALQRLR